MRSFLLSLPAAAQYCLIVAVTILAAFISGAGVHYLFHSLELLSKTELITAIYAVLGTIYAVLIAFSVSGVWANYCSTDLAVAAEAASLTDLIHMTRSSSTDLADKIQSLAVDYTRDVIILEWPALARGDINSVMTQNSPTFLCAMNILRIVQSVQPANTRDNVVYSHMLTLVTKWLDARRNRIMLAKGNIAKALWPLLITGAFALFAFHGLFITEDHMLWSILLLLFSGIIGSSFYLIFTLDCPFSGMPAIDASPFHWSLNCLKHEYRDKIQSN